MTSENTAPETNVAETKPEDRTRFMPHIGNFAPETQLNSVFRFNCPSGTTADDLVLPEFWGHVAHRMGEGDLIHVRCVDNSFYAELLVITATKKDVTRDGLEVDRAKVELLRFLPLGREVAPETGALTVEWRGDSDRWVAVNKKTNEPLKTHFPDRESAQKWINKSFGIPTEQPEKKTAGKTAKQ